MLLNRLILVAFAAIVAAGILPPSASAATQIVGESGRVVPTYADIAGLTLRAPLVIDATIRSASRITGAEAATVPAGYQRYYVTAVIGSLLHGAGGLPPEIGYVVDAPLDFAGRSPKLRKSRVILFARPVTGRPSQVQLIDFDAQRAWTPELDPLVRQIISESLDPHAPPVVNGIGNAFFVPGALPEEGESQIFLITDNGDPVSLLIDHNPGQPPQWVISLSDIVGDASPPPRRNTLLWYRLACGLPPALPPKALDNADSAEAEIVRGDYRMVMATLGPCTGKRR